VLHQRLSGATVQLSVNTRYIFVHLFLCHFRKCLIVHSYVLCLHMGGNPQWESTVGSKSVCVCVCVCVCVASGCVWMQIIAIITGKKSSEYQILTFNHD